MSDPAKLTKEYRPTMNADVLHSWAADVVAALRPIGVRCTGCGSSWDDDRLAEEKSKRPELISCCPERKIVPVYTRPAPRPDMERELAEARADKAVLLAVVAFAQETDEIHAFLTSWMDGSADVDPEWADWQELRKHLVLDGNAAKQPIAALSGASIPAPAANETYCKDDCYCALVGQAPAAECTAAIRAISTPARREGE